MKKFTVNLTLGKFNELSSYIAIVLAFVWFIAIVLEFVWRIEIVLVAIVRYIAVVLVFVWCIEIVLAISWYIEILLATVWYIAIVLAFVWCIEIVLAIVRYIAIVLVFVWCIEIVLAISWYIAIVLAIVWYFATLIAVRWYQTTLDVKFCAYLEQNLLHVDYIQNNGKSVEASRHCACSAVPNDRVLHEACWLAQLAHFLLVATSHHLPFRTDTQNVLTKTVDSNCPGGLDFLPQ